MKTHKTSRRFALSFTLASAMATTTTPGAVTPGGTFGDQAIIIEAGGGEPLTRALGDGLFGPTLTHDFDTGVLVEGSYELNPSGLDATQIALSAGRHLVMYDARFDAAAGTTRAEILTNLTLAGAELAIGRSQGYIRRQSGSNETVMSGGGIITVANDDDILTLQSRRSDDNSVTTVVPARFANGTAIQLLKLDDNWDFLSVQRSSNQAGTVGGTAVDVAYDQIAASSSLGTAFSFTAGTSDVTLNEAGLYLVFANTRIEKGDTNNTRTNYQQRLTLDGAEVEGSKTTTYLRGEGNGEDTQSGVTAIGTLVSATPGQILNVELKMESGGFASTIQGNETALTIVKLPFTAKSISLLHGASQEVNNAATTPIIFDTLNGGSSAFSHTSGTSQVTVNATDDYLFFGSIFTSSDSANDNHIRVVPWQGWQIDGAGGQIARGRGAAYNRDNGGNRTSGSWGGLLASLSSGQVVELTSEALAGGNLGLTSSVSLRGLSISSLIPNNDPSVVTNSTLTLLPGATGTIDDSLLDTFDGDTADSSLTYTITSVPSGGTLSHTVNGTLGLNDTFTQLEVNDETIEFTGDASPATGGFDFTVSDGSASDSGSFVVVVKYVDSVVTITSDGDVTEGEPAEWTLNATVAPVGSNLTVDINFSGIASDGSDFTSVASVDMPAGSTSATLSVATLLDGAFEGNETLIASIGSMSGGQVSPIAGSPSSAIVLIGDGNSSPTGTNLAQVAVGSFAGNIPLNDITVFDPDDSTRSSLIGLGTPLVYYAGLSNISTFSDGRASDDSSFDIDATGPALAVASGYSIEMDFTVEAADLTGTVLVWEIGGSSNGSSILLVNGIPHLLVKSGGLPADVPTDDLSAVGVFTDLSWLGDNTIVVPLSTIALVPGAPVRLAMILSDASDSVTFSVNGAASATANLASNDSSNWVGDHTVNVGINVGTGTGGNTNTPGSPFTDLDIKVLSGGSAAVSSLKFWNESDGAGIFASIGAVDQVTVTLSIQNYETGLEGELTAASGNGESFDNASGEWTVTGDPSTVTAALAAVEFVPGFVPTDPTVILVLIEDGDEDGGGPTVGTILVSETVPDPIYVDDDFSGTAVGSAIADADSGSAVSPATMSYNAFATIGEALSAVQPNGTVIVNSGDYSNEAVSLNDTVTLQLTGSGGSPITIASLAASETPSIDLGAETLVLGDDNDAIVQCGISGSGNLTKVGTGQFILHNPVTYTGTTTISDGAFRVGFVNALGFQSSLDGNGPIVVNSPGILEFNTDVDKSQTYSGQISGDGEVRTLGDGTLVLDGPGGNTFTGRFILGDGASSFFDGETGVKQGFVVVNHNDHLGAGVVQSRGSQLRAGTAGIVIPNDFEIDGGGFRCGGLIGFEIAGDITNINSSARGYSNVGLDGVDLVISGNISLPTSASNLNFEGSEGKDNGSWTVTGNITGLANVLLQNNFDNGEVTLSGTNTYTGTTTIGGGIVGGTMFLNGSHTGGGNYLVNNSTLAGTGATESNVTIQSNGNLSPGGTGIGTLSVGTLDLNGTLAIDVNNTTGAGGTDWDQIAVTGTIDLSTGSLVVTQSTTVEGSPSAIVVVSNDDVDDVTGTFAFGDPFTTNFLGSGLAGLVDYEGGDGNDILLTIGSANAIGSWRFQYFGSASNTGDGSDFSDAGDLDGLNNLLEFGFGTDPNSDDNANLAIDGSVSGIPIVDLDGGAFRGVFVRRIDHGDSGSVRYVPQFSSDLDNWYESADPVGVLVSPVGANSDYELVSVPFPIFLPDTSIPQYFRVNVVFVP
ncbi:hypothetical protein OAF84_04135 [Akkermansiaceae bacterium]|nr:hypothetical protein [Akkermansiaceae bacterium]